MGNGFTVFSELKVNISCLRRWPEQTEEHARDHADDRGISQADGAQILVRVAVLVGPEMCCGKSKDDQKRTEHAQQSKSPSAEGDHAVEHQHLVQRGQHLAAISDAE